MKNFVITGCPRSGTLFLATNMNLSKKWTVLHEAGGYDDLKKNTIEPIQRRLNKDYYGEVNGYLRHRILKLNVSKKALILRNPVDIWISMSNRKKQKLWNGVLIELENTYNEFANLIKSDIRFILFDRMITDLKYLKGIFSYVEIDDVRITKEMQMKKINENRGEIKYHCLSDFDASIQNRIIKIRDIYMEMKNVVRLNDPPF